MEARQVFVEEVGCAPSLWLLLLPFSLFSFWQQLLCFFGGKMNVKEESKRKQSQQIEEEVVIFRREAALD